MDGQPIEVRDGAGVVELLGSSFASVLCLSGEPSRLHAYDGEGSLGQLAARAAPGTVRPGELDALRDWLTHPGLTVDPGTGQVSGLRAGALEPFTRLLAPGSYVVTASAPDWAGIFVTDPGADGLASWYAPMHGDAIVPTGPWPPRDGGALARYRRHIAQGVRPAAVVIGPAGLPVRYLLDGHHKLFAYQLQRVRPLLIELAPAEPAPLARDRFAGLLREDLRARFRPTLEHWR